MLAGMTDTQGGRWAVAPRRARGSLLGSVYVVGGLHLVGWGVLIVEYELPGGTKIYSELDGARTWQDDPENSGATFVGADFQLGEQDTLNFFLTTSILGDPAPLETWGLGLIYSRDWSDAPLTP